VPMDCIDSLITWHKSTVISMHPKRRISVAYEDLDSTYQIHVASWTFSGFAVPE